MVSPGVNRAHVRVHVTRDLGLFDVTMSAVGSMVGAAIFLLIGALFAVSGPQFLLSLGTAALLATLAGFAYAELAVGRPDASGGAYVWVRNALPAPSGFVSGWLSWGGHIAATALGAAGLGIFLLEIARPSGPGGWFRPIPFEASLLAVAMLGVSAAFHFGRIHVSARALGRLNLAKLLSMVLVAGIGIVSLSQPGPSRGIGDVAVAPGSFGVILGAAVLFIAFQGFEVVAQLTDQAKRPESTVPRSLFLSLLIALAVYAVFLIAILENVPRDLLSGWPACAACVGGSQDVVFASVPNFVGQPYVREALLLIGAASMYGVMNANLTAATRTSFSMAQDGLLPSALSRIGGREVPPAALAASAFGAVFLIFLAIETIAILASLAFLGLFAFVHASVIASRRRERRSAPGFRMPFVPALPVVGISLNLAVGASLWSYPAVAGAPMGPGVLAMYLGTLWLALGLIYHWIAGGRRTALGPSVLPRAEVREILAPAVEPVELERYRVFLPLREFTDEALVQFGARVARARGGELSLLHVVEIPRNLPPKAIRFRYVDDRIRGLQRLARIGTHLGIDTRPVVKIGYKVYEIILDTVREEAVDLLVMGWRGARVEGERRVFGSNIDYLIENAPCDVVVFKTQGLHAPLRKVVILTSPIWSLDGIDELALILAEDDRPSIEIVGFAGDPKEAERLKEAAAGFEARARRMGIDVEPKIVYSAQWESEALRESTEASLLLIRAASPGGARKFSLSPMEDRIVKLARCPVLILRKGS